jgi:hypothetical protein
MAEKARQHGDRREARAVAGQLDRAAVAECIIEEMARRQGHRFGPYFDWNLATESFQSRFNAVWPAASLNAAQASLEEFARGFVDTWPEGMAALRIVPDSLDPIANPPYSRDGMWPAFLRRRK